jgi:hypothetical protein
VNLLVININKKKFIQSQIQYINVLELLVIQAIPTDFGVDACTADRAAALDTFCYTLECAAALAMMIFQANLFLLDFFQFCCQFCYTRAAYLLCWILFAED